MTGETPHARYVLGEKGELQRSGWYRNIVPLFAVRPVEAECKCKCFFTIPVCEHAEDHHRRMRENDAG